MSELVPVTEPLIIETPSVRITPNGVEFNGMMSFEEAQVWVRQLSSYERSRAAIIADTWDYIELVFGDEAWQLLDAEEWGLDPITIANYRSVLRRVPRERRRFDTLSFSHHEVVASLEPDEQTFWLDQAIDQHWNRTELRQAIKLDKGVVETPREPDLGTLERWVADAPTPEIQRERTDRIVERLSLPVSFEREAIERMIDCVTEIWTAAQAQDYATIAQRAEILMEMLQGAQ